MVISVTKMLILAILAHFWPFFYLLQPQYLSWLFQISIFFIVLIGLSEIVRKIQDNYKILGKNADFGYFSLFMACFWPVTAPVSVLNIPNEYIFYNSNHIERDWQHFDKLRNFRQKCQFWPFWVLLACFWPVFDLFWPW